MNYNLALDTNYFVFTVVDVNNDFLAKNMFQ